MDKLRILAPVLELETRSKVLLVKVDVDACPLTAEKYMVTSMPTVIGVRDGKEVSRFVGSRDRIFVGKFIQSLC